MSGDRLVYSSEHGRLCPECGAPADACRCRPERRRSKTRARDRDTATPVPPADGVVRVGRSTKGRRGKVVTTVIGVPGSDAERTALAGELKRRCGTGGSHKDGVIEIQGEHRDTLVEELERRGHRVKRVG